METILKDARWVRMTNQGGGLSLFFSFLKTCAPQRKREFIKGKGGARGSRTIFRKVSLNSKKGGQRREDGGDFSIEHLDPSTIGGTIPSRKAN